MNNAATSVIPPSLDRSRDALASPNGSIAINKFSPLPCTEASEAHCLAYIAARDGGATSISGVARHFGVAVKPGTNTEQIARDVLTMVRAHDFESGPLDDARFVMELVVRCQRWHLEALAYLTRSDRAA
jgi:hypothetical protein